MMTQTKVGQKKSVQFTADVGDDQFNTTKTGLTPSVNRLAPRYKEPKQRSAQAQCVAPPSTISRPNYEGILVVYTPEVLAIVDYFDVSIP